MPQLCGTRDRLMQKNVVKYLQKVANALNSNVAGFDGFDFEIFRLSSGYFGQLATAAS